MKTKYLLFLYFITFLASSSFAQLTVKGISRVGNKKEIRQARTENTPIALPFWDDFSTSQNLPSVDLWVDSDNVWINDGMGIDPPSLNVATFDGLDVEGKPYSLDPLSDGITDVLTSCEIDLSGLSSADNVFLSFFYQTKGNGEIPNDNDSIRVEFKDINGVWRRAWSVKGGLVNPDIFNQVSIQLTDANFFHDAFQFKFESYGRQSGPFDTWNIDYVYLNDNVTNFDYPDRAVQTSPSSIFTLYTSLPIHHFNQDPSSLLETSVSSAYNLFDLLQPSNFSIIVEVQSLQPDQSILTTKDTLAYEVISSFPDPQLTGVRQIDLIADQQFNPSKVQTDTLANLSVKLFMNTDDNEPPDYQPEFAPLDFRINDTTYTQQVLHDFYAYDDGGAEFAAGLNFAGDMVAYEFPMLYTGTDTLVSVDMYFPNLGGNVGGQTLEILVWSELDNNPGSLLHSEFVNLKAPEAINKFTTYELFNPVIVQDTFYLGWRQTNAGSLDIGLDKNTDSGDRMYFNLDGTWQQNTKVEGSLMLRPRFGKIDLVLSSDDLVENQIELYPNPTTGDFIITGEFDTIEVFNTQGRAIPFELGREQSSINQININNAPTGVYILRLRKGNTLISKRISLIH